MIEIKKFERDLSSVLENLMVHPTLESRLQGLREFAGQEICSADQVSSGLDRKVRLLRDASAKLGLGAASFSAFRKELLEMRRKALQQDALEVIDDPSVGSRDAFAAVAFIGRQGDQGAQSHLFTVELRDQTAGLVKLAIEKSKASSSPPTKRMVNSSYSPTGGPVTLKQAYAAIKKIAQSGTKTDLRASQTAAELELPLWETQWALEDLASAGLLVRRYCAMRSGGGVHWHCSKEAHDWRLLLQSPVTCCECSTIFSPDPSEIFAFYRTR